MKFSKVHSLGNDFIFIGSPSSSPCPDNSFIVQSCNRKLGIGSDGFIVISRSRVADYRMRIFNSDGSEAEMCGNALRCSAGYVVESGYSTKKSFTVETLAGIRKAVIENDGVKAYIGKPNITDSGVIAVNGKELSYVSVSTGNPHCVIFGNPLTDDEFFTLAPKIERHPLFPQGTNVEFASVTHSGSILMRVWERGVGETLACGTGSTAAAFAAYSAGLCGSTTDVHQKGGILKCCITEDDAWVKGSYTLVFRGEIN